MSTEKSDFQVVSNFVLHVESREMGEEFIRHITLLLRKYRKFGAAKTAVTGTASVVEEIKTSKVDRWTLNDNGFADLENGENVERRISGDDYKL